MIDNSEFRYGSAEFATQSELRKAGMFKQKPNSLLVGFDGHRPIFYSGTGGVILVAGARSGKLTTNLAYNVCHSICSATQIILDPKAELAAISQDQTPDKKHCIYWNPNGLGGLPQHRINPLEYLRIDSPSLVSDFKAFCENRIPNSGSSNAAYFEGRAREFCEAIGLTLVEKKGTLTLPDLYHALNLIVTESEEWLNFAYDMSKSRFPIARRIEEEIAASRESNGNGFQSILGELYRNFASLSDPDLLASVSPPYNFSLSDLTASDQKYNFYLMPPAEFIESWAPEIKSIFVAAMIYKSRAPHAPQQTWLLDECGQLQNFPLITKMFTYGAGSAGILPVAVFQSTQQMNALGKNAENIITSSAACRIYFGVRDLDTASTLSRMLGMQTLEYFDEQKHLQMRHAKSQAVQSLLTDDDPTAAGMNYVHHKRGLATPQKIQRSIRTPDEILNTKPLQQYIFVDGVSKPILSTGKPYYMNPAMTGRYHPNPYIDKDLTRVRVKSHVGYITKRIIAAPVPNEYADYPQYQNHPYSYVEK